MLSRARSVGEMGSIGKVMLSHGDVVDAPVFARERAPAVLNDPDRARLAVVQFPETMIMVSSKACFLRLSVIRDTIAT